MKAHQQCFGPISALLTEFENPGLNPHNRGIIDYQLYLTLYIYVLPYIQPNDSTWYGDDSH